MRRSAEQTVEEIFEALRSEGWLDHLRADPHGARGSGETP